MTVQVDTSIVSSATNILLPHGAEGVYGYVNDAGVTRASGRHRSRQMPTEW